MTVESIAPLSHNLALQLPMSVRPYAPDIAPDVRLLLWQSELEPNLVGVKDNNKRRRHPMKFGKRNNLVQAFAILCVAWASQSWAANKCVTVAHDLNSGESLSMDPALNFGLDNAGLLVNVYDALVDFDSNFELVPRLATSWEANADATEWTFQLREGVRFHDGSDFDAADVVYSYNRVLDPDIGSPGKALLDPFVASVEVVDTYTVRFNLTQPTATAPLRLRNKWTYIVPEGIAREQFEQAGIGTGPFMQESFDRGATFHELVRNPDYWEPDLPKADCLRVTVIDEPITRAAALLSGDIDVASVIDPELVGLLTKNEAVMVQTAPGGGPLVLNMLTDAPPFDDVRVRRAMKLVVDRQAIVDGPLLGIGEPGNDTPIPPSNPSAHRNDIQPRDIDQARSLLAEAGYPDGIDVELYTAPAGIGYVSTAQAYAQMAAEAGIRVKINIMPAAGYWSEVWMKKPFSSSNWGARHPVEALGVGYRSDAKWNDTRWYNDEFDSLLDKANATVDLGERAVHLKAAQQLLADDGGAIVPAFFPVVSATRSNCTGYEPHTIRFYFNFRTVECAN